MLLELKLINLSCKKTKSFLSYKIKYEHLFHKVIMKYIFITPIDLAIKSQVGVLKNADYHLASRS